MWVMTSIEMPGYCHRVALRRPNAPCPNRPSQNEFRKRVPVRLCCATARLVRLRHGSFREKAAI